MGLGCGVDGAGGSDDAGVDKQANDAALFCNKSDDGPALGCMGDAGPCAALGCTGDATGVVLDDGGDVFVASPFDIALVPEPAVDG